MCSSDLTKKVLLVGIGNSARGDDALGWAFIDKISSCIRHVEFRYCYQLQIEDAELINAYDEVVFVDASHQSLPEGYSITEVQPSGNFSFTAHKLSPSSVLWLCGELFNKYPKVFLVAISGFEWELGSPLTDFAQENLRKAVEYFSNSNFFSPKCDETLKSLSTKAV